MQVCIVNSTKNFFQHFKLHNCQQTAYYNYQHAMRFWYTAQFLQTFYHLLIRKAILGLIWHVVNTGKKPNLNKNAGIVTHLTKMFYINSLHK